MTQKDLILDYCKQNGSILPAKMSGVIYKDTMFGSETSKRCRELRKKGILNSYKDGKFQRFILRKIEFSGEDLNWEIKKIETFNYTFPKQPQLSGISTVARPL